MDCMLIINHITNHMNINPLCDCTVYIVLASIEVVNEIEINIQYFYSQITIYHN